MSASLDRTGSLPSRFPPAASSPRSAGRFAGGGGASSGMDSTSSTSSSGGNASGGIGGMGGGSSFGGGSGAGPYGAAAYGSNDYSHSSNAGPRRGSLPGLPEDSTTNSYPRRGSIPAHMQTQMGGYNPRQGHGHGRRASVVDIAAEYMGPQATENLAKAKQFSSKAEDWIEHATKPIRSFLPGLGRFLIVVTFLEDALRILTQITDQNYYLQKHRGFPWGLSHIFLLTNVAVMLACSCLVIAKRFPAYATGGLFTVVLAQGFGYGLIFDLNFFLRNLSVIGGLLMVLSDSLSQRKSSVVGIPSMGLNDADRKKYFQLAGRVLLVFLFLGFVFNGHFSLTRGFVSLSGLIACLMVAVGYKAKLSACYLVFILSIFNFFVNNWWSVHASHPQRDFLKYDFFQTLSIVGGLLLLVNLGPGDFSVDQKKRM